MNKKISSLLQYAFFLGLGIFLIWWSVRKISPAQWQEMKISLINADYWLFLPVSLALLISHLSRAVRWKILIEPLGYKPSTQNTYLVVLIGYLANLALPRLGEVLKCTILGRYEKIPADKLIGTIVAERAFDLICLLLVFVIAIFSQIEIIGSYASELVQNLLTGGTGKVNYYRLIIVLAGLIILVAGSLYVLKRFAHVSFIRTIKLLGKGIWEGLTSVRFVKKKGWFFFHTILIWFLYLASIRLGFIAFEETRQFGWLPAFSVLSLGSIGMIVTPGGLGAYPYLVQKTMILYGVSEGIGKAFGWVLWLAQFLLVAIAGGAALLLLPVVNRKKHKSAITQ
jgi:uncharacterized protein (TIRG00374 family)